MCVCVYVYMCVRVYTYLYTYKHGFPDKQNVDSSAISVIGRNHKLPGFESRFAISCNSCKRQAAMIDYTL